MPCCPCCSCSGTSAAAGSTPPVTACRPAIYPLQLAVNSPSAAWRWLEESFTTRETLQAEVDAAAQPAARPATRHAAPGGAGPGKRHAARPELPRCPRSSKSGSSAKSSASRCPRCASGCWSIAAAMIGVFKAPARDHRRRRARPGVPHRPVQLRDHPDHRCRTCAARAGAALRRAHHCAGHRRAPPRSNYPTCRRTTTWWSATCWSPPASARYFPSACPWRA